MCRVLATITNYVHHFLCKNGNLFISLISFQTKYNVIICHRSHNIFIPDSAQWSGACIFFNVLCRLCIGSLHMQSLMIGNMVCWVTVYSTNMYVQLSFKLILHAQPFYSSLYFRVVSGVGPSIPVLGGPHASRERVGFGVVCPIGPPKFAKM